MCEKTMSFSQVILNKDPAKLPKEDGDYFCCRSGFKTVYGFKKGQNEMGWLKEVSWYIVQVEENPVWTKTIDVQKMSNVINEWIHS